VLQAIKTKSYFIFSVVIFLAPSFSYAAKKISKEQIYKQKINAYKKFSNTTINVSGKYNKHDDKNIYLNVEGAKTLIKIPRKYILNSPTFLSKGEKVSVDLPIGRYLTDNSPRKSKVSR
jgi:hypothetical protein